MGFSWSFLYSKQALNTECKLNSASKRKQIHKSSCFHFKRVLAINDTITAKCCLFADLPEADPEAKNPE
jgi:hypothetical protein